jgi:hypothetical protein
MGCLEDIPLTFGEELDTLAVVCLAPNPFTFDKTRSIGMNDLARVIRYRKKDERLA